MGNLACYQGAAAIKRKLESKITKLKEENEKLRNGWQTLSVMMRTSYNYTEYCYWCEEACGDHKDNCEFVDALLTKEQSNVR